MRAPRPCGVCGAAGAAPYRCPRCAAAYCSVPCCRTHKERCAPEPRPEPEPEPERAGGPGGPVEQRAGGPWSVDDILTDGDEQDRVPLHRLRRLAAQSIPVLTAGPHRFKYHIPGPSLSFFESSHGKQGCSQLHL
ncbi:zinc finger HIT domain-containing protein 3 isoform X2 [Columba livia]|uniref:zinc finger HIT domain-containing protein 3 isoform X2 n=1 Tax=Columba livia TaxID=8932 RepID=UPI0031B9EC01